MNKLIREERTETGETIYKMVTFDIEVIAKQAGGLAPTIIYLMDGEDVTDEIRALRFHPENPSSFIVDFPQFQTMLYEKEQRAINNLYEQISLKPKNMSTKKQVLWSFGLTLLILLPFIIAAFLGK